MSDEVMATERDSLNAQGLKTQNYPCTKGVMSDDRRAIA